MRKLVLAALVAVTLAPSVAQASTGWARYEGSTYVRWHTHISRPTDDHVASWLRYNQARHRAVLRARHAHSAWMEQQRAIEAQRGSQAQHGPPSQGGGSGGCAHGFVHDLILRDFPASQWATAFYVARRESNCDPFAYNPHRLPLGHASGVAQILAPGNWDPWSRSCGYGGASVFNAAANVGTWACMVRRLGWGPWGG